MTDQEIEAAVRAAGGQWDGNVWRFEDADLHPFVRSIVATPAAAAEPVCLRHPDGSINVEAIGCGTPPAAATSDDILKKLRFVLRVLDNFAEAPVADRADAHQMVRELIETEWKAGRAAATSTPCASGEGLPEMKSYAQPCTDRPREDQYSFGRYVDGWNSCHKAFTRALAATQAPATREAGLWAELLEFLEDHEDVSDGPDGEQRPNRAMQLAQAMRDAATRTPTAGNTEDARSMGAAVPATDARAERTPTDYALEHAEYMATAAEHLIEAVDALGLAQMRLEESYDPDLDPDVTTLDEAVDQARDSLSEALGTMRNRIYGFRTRRDRAALTQAASTGGAAS